MYVVFLFLWFMCYIGGYKKNCLKSVPHREQGTMEFRTALILKRFCFYIFQSFISYRLLKFVKSKICKLC